MLAKLALQNKLLSEEQLQTAFQRQQAERAQGRNFPLRIILVRSGLLTQPQMVQLVSAQKLMAAQPQEQFFGGIAVQEGFATNDDIERALARQQEEFGKTKTVKLIGDILIETGTITKEQRDTILERQGRLALFQPDKPAVKSESALTAASDFEIDISEDSLVARVRSKKSEPSSLSTTDFKEFLVANGVSFGIAEDAALEVFLKNASDSDEPFVVAQGVPAKPGKDAVVTYAAADNRPNPSGKTAGTEKAESDAWRSRIVQKGEIIATKTPSEQGTAGKDVLGGTIKPVEPKDSPLLPGKGVELSEDGLRLTALIDGRAHIFDDGKLHVHPELRIQGDLDSKTGNLDFDGDIIVEGAIQEEARVKGGTLTASEIHKAYIEVAGDVVVHNGIHGATINTRGGVEALFIHEARIKAFGDVKSEKEVIDSEMELNGACLVPNGSILSSKITTKKGVVCKYLGDESSSPCVLTVGVSDRINNEIERLASTRQPLVDEWEKLLVQRKALSSELELTSANLAEVTQEQDRILVSRRENTEKTSSLPKTDSVQRGTCARAAQELQPRQSELDARIDKLFEREDSLRTELASVNNRSEDARRRIILLDDELKALTDLGHSEKAIPEVRILGTVSPYTTIKGVHASLTLKEGKGCVLLSEKLCGSSHDPTAWHFVTSTISPNT